MSDYRSDAKLLRLFIALLLAPPSHDAAQTRRASESAVGPSPSRERVRNALAALVGYRGGRSRGGGRRRGGDDADASITRGRGGIPNWCAVGVRLGQR